MVVGEKRITKTFQYDTPGELVMTYLSQVSTSLYGSLLAKQTTWAFPMDVWGMQSGVVSVWTGQVPC